MGAAPSVMPDPKKLGSSLVSTNIQYQWIVMKNVFWYDGPSKDPTGRILMEGPLSLLTEKHIPEKCVRETIVRKRSMVRHHVYQHSSSNVQAHGCIRRVASSPQWVRAIHSWNQVRRAKRDIDRIPTCIEGSQERQKVWPKISQETRKCIVHESD